MPSIRRLINGRWIAQVRRVGQDSRAKTFDTQAAAKAWAFREEASLLASRGPNQASSMTLHRLLDWFDEVQVPRYRSKATAWGITSCLKRHLPNHELALISPIQITQYRELRLRSGLSPASVTRELNLLSRAISLAISELGVRLANNPAKAVSRPSGSKSRDRRPHKTELAALRKAADRDSPALNPIIDLAIETGMRQGELFSLKIEDLDRQSSVVYLETTKNGDSRYVPLSPRALAAFDALAGSRDSGALITQWSTQSGLRQSWRRACIAAGVSNLRFHDLRHEAASRFFELGLNQIQVASITGHKTLQVLKRYTHLRPQDLAKLLAEKSS